MKLDSNLMKAVNVALGKLNAQEKQKEKFALPLLAARAKNAAINNPGDQTLRVLANVFGRMSENGQVLISRAEFNKVYSQVAEPRTIAANYFADELNLPEQKKERAIAGAAAEEYLDLYKTSDTETLDQLNAYFAKDETVKVADSKILSQAAVITNLRLIGMGAPAKSVKGIGGTDKLIVCDATYETPKGAAHVIIPLEVERTTIAMPEVFYNKSDLVKLTKEAIDNYVEEFAGKSNHVITTNITSQKTGALVMPKAEGFETFAAQLSTQKGTAEFIFGKEAVDNGRNVILSKLAMLGYKGQVSVASCDDTTITYGVKLSSLNSPVGFEVMADIRDGKVIVPSIVAIQDKAYEFNKSGIETLIKSNSVDYKAMSVCSPAYEMKPSEIMERIRVAADEGNFAEAEDSLLVLAGKGTPEQYAAGVAEYMRSVEASAGGGITKQACASCGCGCKNIVRNSSHTVPMCGHLNLPLDKVYQNERGECCPLYRKNMDDTYACGVFNSSKIVLQG